jgi:hypothetical protein
LIRIDRTGLYHWGAGRCPARIVGVARARAVPAPMFCLAGVLAAGAVRGPAAPVTARTGRFWQPPGQARAGGSSSASAVFRCCSR